MTKRLGIIGGLLAFAAVLVIVTSGLPSCEALKKNPRLVKLADLGLTVGLKIAEHNNVINPGDSLLIHQGFAILTSADTNESKLVQLEDIGLTEAVKAGVIQEGDRVIIKDVSEALIIPPPPLVPEVPILTDTTPPPALPVQGSGK